MSRCFESSSKLSATEYIYKKRNFANFCDLRSKFIANNYHATGTTIACLNNSGIISQFNNQSSQINIKKGFEEWSIINRPQDISKSYIGQQINSDMKFCSPYGPNTLDSSGNEDISNNYSYQSPLLTTSATDSTGQTIVIDSSGQYINRYAEINTSGEDGTDGFSCGKKRIYENCPIRDSGRIQVMIASEVPPPLLSSFELIFV